MEAFRNEMNRACRKVEGYLDTCFQGQPAYGRLYEAMRYSLLAGGKRIRPVLVLEFCRALGGDEDKALPFAAAIEMIHTYSLIHDDLPCMDDDDLRRGRPTNHKVYGQCLAVLAGDALQPEAFRQIANADLPAQRRIAAAGILAENAGADGMVAGQVLDMEGEKRTLSLDEITQVCRLKTGCLLEGACRMGVAAAGGDDRAMDAATRYARAIGLAFQVQDDILDVTSTPEEMGKSVQTDAQRGKSTFVSLLGMDACREMIGRLTAEAKQAVSELNCNTEFFNCLADYLAGRSN